MHQKRLVATTQHTLSQLECESQRLVSELAERTASLNDSESQKQELVSIIRAAQLKIRESDSRQVYAVIMIVFDYITSCFM